MVSVTVSGDAWVGKFSRAPCEFWGKDSKEKGPKWRQVKRAVWKILLRRVIFADVHYTLARVRKISGITVLPFVFGEQIIGWGLHYELFEATANICWASSSNCEWNRGPMSTTVYLLVPLETHFKALNELHYCACGLTLLGPVTCINTKFPAHTTGKDLSRCSELWSVWESENCPPYLKELR